MLVVQFVATKCCSIQTLSEQAETVTFKAASSRMYTHIFKISLCCSFESFLYFTSAAGMLVCSGLGLCDKVSLRGK